jgi:DNA invertase Pin-like site-specific DNA recombinase
VTSLGRTHRLPCANVSAPKQIATISEGNGGQSHRRHRRGRDIGGRSCRLLGGRWQIGHHHREAQRMHVSGESASNIAAALSVSRATIYRVLAQGN